MKAADIQDSEILALVERRRENGTPFTSFDIKDALADRFPSKVIQAKLAQMVNKGRLIGCACGCRGDFRVPDMEGRE